MRSVVGKINDYLGGKCYGEIVVEVNRRKKRREEMCGEDLYMLQ